MSYKNATQKPLVKGHKKSQLCRDVLELKIKRLLTNVVLLDQMEVRCVGGHGGDLHALRVTL